VQLAAAANMTLGAVGMAVAATSDQDGAQVLSVDKDGPAAKAGVVADDVIQAVGAQAVTSANDLRDSLKTISGSDQKVATLLVSGDDSTGDDPGPRWLAVAVK
jgi:S1-C subfamily serine protease